MSADLSAPPRLYTYRRCPYAMRARMALLQAGVAYEAVEIVLRDKPAAMLAVSPKGTVPVLVLSDGRVIEQSWDIVCWAFEHTGDAQGWWARAQTAANRSLLIDDRGQTVVRYDKLHVYDVDLPTGERWRESAASASSTKPNGRPEKLTSRWRAAQ